MSLAAAAPAFATSHEPPGVLEFSPGDTSVQPVVIEVAGGNETYYNLVFAGASVSANPAGTNPGPRVVTLTVTFQPTAGGTGLYWSGIPLPGWTAGSGMPSDPGPADVDTVVLVSNSALVFGDSLTLAGTCFGTLQDNQFGTFRLTFGADNYLEAHATFSTPPPPAGRAGARRSGPVTSRA